MASVSNISVGSSYAGNMVHKYNRKEINSIMRLSSGSRTVMGGDAAGQSIGNNLMARAKSHYVAARNAEDGISALLTAESAFNEIIKISYRLREIGIAASNKDLHQYATVNSSNMYVEMETLKSEANMLYQTLNNIGQFSIKYNGIRLTNFDQEISFEIGSSIDGTNNTTIKTNANSPLYGPHRWANGNTQFGAEASADLILIDMALNLGNIAASLSSLKARQSVSYASAANLEAAASRVLDTDYARETANLTKASVLNQSAMVMVAQANQVQPDILATL